MVVINNSRSESDQLGAPADASRNKRVAEDQLATTNKFIADLAQADEDDYGSFSFPPELEKEMAKVANHTEMQSPETPRKAGKAVKTSQFSTPGSKRKREEDALPTPITNDRRSTTPYNPSVRDEDVFNTPSSMLKGGLRGNNDRFGFCSPSVTPSRYRESTEAIEDRVERAQQSYDISDDVIELLQDQHIDEDTTAILREMLSKHALKISGIAKGRDITRVALKAKDAKIAELQQRISALEAERDMDKTIIRHFKSNVAHSIQNRRGRGRGKT